MANQFLIISDENGNIADLHVRQNIMNAMGTVFGFQDVFFYSHGWWTTAETATEVYNRFSIELAAQAIALAASLPVVPNFGLGIHWPSMLSENTTSAINIAEALSYFGMGNRANSVGSNAGFALLRLLVESRNANPAPLRLHLIGHSFGCKVICMALQRLVDKGIAASELTGKVSIDAALIQAAFNDDELENTSIADYQNVIGGIPGLRMLITTSTEDKALNVLFKAAQGAANLFNRARPALGAAGPTPEEVSQFGGRVDLSIKPGFSFAAAPTLKHKRLVVADLSPVHKANTGYQKDANMSDIAFGLMGHHSDIYLPELYRLLLAFFFK
jgi:hypothetical protein